MTILLIDTSHQPVTLAVVKAGEVIDQSAWENTPALGQQLLSEIDALFERQKMTWADIDRIAVVEGPGHYSALRHGIVTAGFLSEALHKEVVALPAGKLTQQTQAAQEATPTTVLQPRYTAAS